MILALMIGTLAGALFCASLAMLIGKIEKSYILTQRKEPPPLTPWSAAIHTSTRESFQVREDLGTLAQVLAWVKALCYFAAAILALAFAGVTAYWLVKNPEFIQIVILKSLRLLVGMVILISVARFLFRLFKELWIFFKEVLHLPGP